MTQSQLEALLGRPLTPTEVTNLTLYLDIANEALETLICTPITNVTGTRTFDTREGYSTVFLDIIRSVSEVKVDGNVTTDYSLRQWDKRNGSWYNSLVFDKRFRKVQEVEVTGAWGFDPVPNDLRSVIAHLFAQVSAKNTFDGTIASKQVEDFRISYHANVTQDDDFTNKYGSIISKYSMCDIPYVKHGDTGNCASCRPTYLAGC